MRVQARHLGRETGVARVGDGDAGGDGGGAVDRGGGRRRAGPAESLLEPGGAAADDRRPSRPGRLKLRGYEIRGHSLRGWV